MQDNSSESMPMFTRVALIGLGLIGTSLAHAMKRQGLAAHITGYAQSQKTRDAVRDMSIVDTVSDNVQEAVRGADLVILCVPVGNLGEVVQEISSVLKPGAILSDVGSVKAAVIDAVGPHVPQGVHFIPAHPISGTERSGPYAGFAELFDGRWCVLTPLEQQGSGYSEAVDRLTHFWSACGAQVETMDAKHHDLVLAITSHVPHLIAYNIVGTAADLENVTRSEVIKYSAGGFRDFTRIAASDPTMWRDVFLNNSEAVLEMLARFSEDLTALQRAIRWKDGDALYNLFSRTREIRRSIIDAGQETSESNFGRIQGDETNADD